MEQRDGGTVVESGAVGQREGGAVEGEWDSERRVRQWVML